MSGCLFWCAKALGAAQEKERFVAVYRGVKGYELRVWGF